MLETAAEPSADPSCEVKLDRAAGAGETRKDSVHLNECPNGHQLRGALVREGEVGCDHCQNVIIFGSLTFFCRLCDYDLCYQCNLRRFDKCYGRSVDMRLNLHGNNVSDVDLRARGWEFGAALRKRTTGEYHGKTQIHGLVHHYWVEPPSLPSSSSASAAQAASSESQPELQEDEPESEVPTTLLMASPSPDAAQHVSSSLPALTSPFPPQPPEANLSAGPGGTPSLFSPRSA